MLEFRGYLGNFYESVPYRLVRPFDEIYQFAADMGGAGFVFTGENDADIMHNSVTINLNVLEEQRKLNDHKGSKFTKIFYSGSSLYIQNIINLILTILTVVKNQYLADPDSEYGWEKLFSERLYFAYNRNHGIPVRVARYHNIFGPEGTWEGGREKSWPAHVRR